LFDGSVDKLFIKILSFWLPCLLHLSAFLFCIGILVFFLEVNRTIFIHVAWFFVVSVGMYTFLTVLPLFQSGSLLYTPISVFPASLMALSTCLVHSAFADRFKFQHWSVLDWLLEDVNITMENISLKRSSEIDVRILQSTLNSLNEDDAMEGFFGAIPDFLSSKWAKPLPANLPAELQDVFKEALYEFLDNSFRSTTVPESAKSTRLMICLDASHAAPGPNGPSWILSNILNGNWPELLRSVEIGHSLRSWVYGNNEENVLYIQSIVSHIVASTETRNDRWLALATDQLGMSEDLLRHYLAHGDSVLLANLINITRLTFRFHLPNWKFHALPSKFDVSSTLPSLQYDFCSLWNEIVLEARNSKSPIPILILKNICPLYVGLHLGTDASESLMAFSATTADNDNLDRASSYPSCNIASHRLESDTTRHEGNEAAIGAVEDVSLAIHSCVQHVPHHSPVLVSGARPFDIPAYNTTRSPADELSFGSVPDAGHAPVPYPPVIPSTLLDSHPVPSGEVSSQQSESIIPPSIVYDSTSMHRLPCTNSGF
jgi:hypothetical protein